MKKIIAVISLVAISTSALAETKPQPIPLTAIIQTGALIYSSQNAMKNNNPYAVLSVAGAATSIAPSLGYDQTLSSVINSFGKK